MTFPLGYCHTCQRDLVRVKDTLGDGEYITGVCVDVESCQAQVDHTEEMKKSRQEGRPLALRPNFKFCPICYGKGILDPRYDTECNRCAGTGIVPIKEYQYGLHEGRLEEKKSILDFIDSWLQRQEVLFPYTSIPLVLLMDALQNNTHRKK